MQTCLTSIKRNICITYKLFKVIICFATEYVILCDCNLVCLALNDRFKSVEYNKYNVTFKVKRQVLWFQVWIFALILVDAVYFLKIVVEPDVPASGNSYPTATYI